MAITPNKSTAISAGFGALLGLQESPFWTAFFVAAGTEVLTQFMERNYPGSMGTTGTSPIEKSVFDVSASLASWWIVKQL